MPKKKKTERESLDFYLSLKYPITLYPDPEVGYVVEIKDLPGCMTQGQTVDEAMSNIEEARKLWIEAVYEQGNDIPLPSTENQYSGRVLLRMPRSLHQQLVENAEREEVSFNQYVVSLLSERNAFRDIANISKQLENIRSLISEQKISSLRKQQFDSSAQYRIVSVDFQEKLFQDFQEKLFQDFQEKLFQDFQEKLFQDFQKAVKKNAKNPQQ